MSGVPNRHALPTILAAMATALLLAACGGGSGGDDGSANEPNDAKRVAYLTCLRKAGVKVHEETGAGGGVGIEVPRGISEVRMREIERDCARKTGGGPGSGPQLSKEQQAEMLDQGLKFSRCMRAHGVDMNDPKVEPGGGFSLGIDGSNANPDSPAFQRAQRACGSLMPRKPGAPKSSSVVGGSEASP
jgi:hypothetical protein